MTLHTTSDILAHLRDTEEWAEQQVQNSHETSDYRRFHAEYARSTRSLIEFYRGRAFTPTSPHED